MEKLQPSPHPPFDLPPATLPSGSAPSSFEALSSKLARLSDKELLAEVGRAAGDERDAKAKLVATLVEVDKRRLYLDAGCSSLYTVCTEVLGLSESEAYLRMEAARAARKFPLILERLADGSLTLTAVSMLARHLTEANHVALLSEASHKSKREIEAILARVRPRPDAVSIVRRLPAVPPVSGNVHKSPVRAEDITGGCAEDRAGVRAEPERPTTMFAASEQGPIGIRRTSTTGHGERTTIFAPVAPVPVEGRSTSTAGHEEPTKLFAATEAAPIEGRPTSTAEHENENWHNWHPAFRDPRLGRAAQRNWFLRRASARCRKLSPAARRVLARGRTSRSSLPNATACR